SVGDELESFGTGLKAAASAELVTPRQGLCLSSVGAARRLLTPHRLTMLRTIRAERPRSIYELAKLLGRDLKNVQTDLRLLERYGLVRTSTGRGTGRRKVKIPHVRFGEISLKIAI